MFQTNKVSLHCPGVGHYAQTFQSIRIKFGMLLQHAGLMNLILILYHMIVI